MSSSRHPQEARLHTDYIQISLATRALSQPSSLSCSPDVTHRKPGYTQTTYRSAWRHVHFRNLLHCRVLLTSPTGSQATHRPAWRHVHFRNLLHKLQALVYDILPWRKVPESDARRVPSSLLCHSHGTHRKPGYIQTTDLPDDTCNCHNLLHSLLCLL